MAEKVSTASDALEIVEERLNCSICLQNLTQPKFLPCLHGFCKDCLVHLPRLAQEDSHMVKCPICSIPAQLHEDGVSVFPNLVHFTDSMDLQQIPMSMAEGQQQVTCGGCNKNLAQGFCRQCERYVCQKCVDAHHQMEGLFAGHEIVTIIWVTAAASQLKPIQKPSTLECPKHKKPLTVYCRAPCDQLICHDCTVCDHCDRKCDPISDESIFQKYKQELYDNLLPTKQRLSFILHKIETLNKQTMAITNNRDRVKEEIRATGEQMIAENATAIQKSTGWLEKEADVVAEQKLRFTSAQKEDAQLTAALLQSCVEYVEGELRMGSQQHLLASKRQILDRMKVVTSQVKEEEYLLMEQPNIMILKSAPRNTDVGEVKFSMVIDKCIVSGEGIMKALVGQSAKFDLVIIPTPGSVPLSLPTSLISCQLYVPEATTCSLTDCNIIQSAPGKYKVSYVPMTCGLQQLRVRVGDVDIPGSPFTVPVIMRGTPLRTIGGLNNPWGVAVCREGSVVVTEYSSHCVTVLDKEGKKIKSFGSHGADDEQLNFPTGVAITRENKIIIADNHNHRIQKFDLEGRFVAPVGSKGNGQLQFLYPAGITTDMDDRLLVADLGNHRIQVMNSELIFVRTFGIQGKRSGQFQYPFCMAVDSKQMVYVTDSDNGRVQKFTLEGVFVSQFGKKGVGKGKFKGPCGISIDTTTDTLYVSSDHKISMFTSTGKFIGEFGRKGNGEGRFNTPCGLAVDESTGDLYVCDYHNNRLVVY